MPKKNCTRFWTSSRRGGTGGNPRVRLGGGSRPSSTASLPPWVKYAVSASLKSQTQTSTSGCFAMLARAYKTNSREEIAKAGATTRTWDVAVDAIASVLAHSFRAFAPAAWRILGFEPHGRNR